MGEPIAPKIAKWPFLVGDILLLGLAWLIASRGRLSLAAAELGVMTVCVAAGALLAVIPYILEYRALARAAEAEALTSVVAQVRNLEAIAEQISGATGRWQFVQEAADKTAASAKSIAEKMAMEVQSFTEFMQKVNDAERGNLRLEVEKLRRVEADWLQALVRVLDHVYALYLGGVRSGQAHLIGQLTNFQNACRDAGRRVGLQAFVPEPEETFDPQRHQLLEGDPKDAVGCEISEVVATGFTFQGRVLRPALVRVKQPGAPPSARPGSAAPAEPQGQLSLEAEAGSSPI